MSRTIKLNLITRVYPRTSIYITTVPHRKVGREVMISDEDYEKLMKLKEASWNYYEMLWSLWNSSEETKIYKED